MMSGNLMASSDERTHGGSQMCATCTRGQDRIWNTCYLNPKTGGKTLFYRLYRTIKVLQGSDIHIFHQVRAKTKKALALVEVKLVSFRLGTNRKC